MRSAKIQIRLRIRAVWSESSLGAHVQSTFSVVSVQMYFIAHIGDDQLS